MNKKGFLRVVEASVAIVAIMTVLFLFYNQDQEIESPDFSIRAAEILKEVSRDSTLREEILIDDDTGLVDFVNERIPEPHLEHEVRICDVTDVCGQSTFVNKEVFSGERVISASLTSLNPRKVKIFIWRKD